MGVKKKTAKKKAAKKKTTKKKVTKKKVTKKKAAPKRKPAAKKSPLECLWNLAPGIRNRRTGSQSKWKLPRWSRR